MAPGTWIADAARVTRSLALPRRLSPATGGLRHGDGVVPGVRRHLVRWRGPRLRSLRPSAAIELRARAGSGGRGVSEPDRLGTGLDESRARLCVCSNPLQNT